MRRLAMTNCVWKLEGAITCRWCSASPDPRAARHVPYRWRWCDKTASTMELEAGLYVMISKRQERWQELSIASQCTDRARYRNVY